MKILKIIALTVGALLIGVLLYAGLSFYQMTRQTQKDLGVRYTTDDAINAMEKKAGVKVYDLSALYFGSEFTTKGSKRVNQTFSDAEISAIQNYANEKSGPFKQVQIHFLGGNKVEASGFIKDPRVTLPGPVYVKGDVIQTGPKSFTTKIDVVQIGDYTVPGPIIEKANTEFIGYVNNILSGIDSLNIKKVEIENGAVKFQGTIPEMIEGKK